MKVRSSFFSQLYPDRPWFLVFSLKDSDPKFLISIFRIISSEAFFFCSLHRALDTSEKVLRAREALLETPHPEHR